ncbi:mitochondrial carrier domain-containing protein [Gorgonomyces haynaldii]|nr:mitochondrial carrier domain-containing protein [Gorgonomyces haynaldii]
MTDSEEFDYESLPTNSVAVNMAAGALAGITEHVVTYPFDSIKTRMQLMNSFYSGFGQAISKTYSQEGAMALWRGVNSVVIGSGPAHALFFAGYEQSKILFKQWDKSEDSHLAHAMAGVVATTLHDSFNTPFDVIKQRLQVAGHSYSGIMDCAVKIAKSEGFGSFYVSLPTTMMMSIPFQSVQFTTYEYCRKRLNPKNEYNPMTHIVSGGLAGGLASLLTNPLDVAKTLLQTRGISQDAVLRNVSGLGQACKIIYKRHGIFGFMRGVQARLLSNMPSTAVAWTTYEFLKVAFIGSSMAPATIPSN